MQILLLYQNRTGGYEFALSELNNLQSIGSEDDFMEFIDSIADE